jgi:lipid-A-disaccharide synthase
MGQPPTIFLSAAEASGDLHAAKLLAALRRRLPEARFVGAAGPKMQQQGCQPLIDLTSRASMMLGPVLRPLYYLRALRRLRKAIRELRPDVVVPVDSPALNWHVAAAARQAGVPVMYYIAPQVWCWAPWRVRKLARLSNRVACILPFEQRYLRDRGVKATYVGHPLFEDIAPRPEPLPDLAGAWLEGAWRVALLPGSRRAELAAHVPALDEVAARIQRRWRGATCTFTAATVADAEVIRGLLRHSRAEVAVDQTRQVLARSHFAVAKSGTVTLEAAYFGVPMVIFYRAPRAFSLLRKLARPWALRTTHLSLVNILAGRTLVPELMPWHGSARKLWDAVLEQMEDLGSLFETRQALLELTDSLRQGGNHASDRAAELVAGMIGR